MTDNKSNRDLSLVTIPRHAWRTAQRQAAQRQAARYADEVLNKLRECERERDDLVRRLADVQARCDNLMGEHKYFTAHVRNLDDDGDERHTGLAR
jgi:hypothetical protein